MIALIAGPIIGFAVERFAFAAERNRAQALLADRAAGVAFAIETEFQADLEILYSLRSLFEAGIPVTMDSFSDITSPFLSRHTCIQALEWIPLVPRDGRSMHERSLRAEGFPEYSITEQLADLGLVDAGQRELYFPVTYVAPLEGNEPALGFDVGSESLRREAIDRAARTREIQLSDPVALVQDTTSSLGVIAILAVSEGPHRASAAVGENTSGFVAAVFRIERLLHQARLGPGDSAFTTIHFELVDENVDGQALMMHGSPLNPGAKPIMGLTFEYPIDIGGQQWRLVAQPTAAYLAPLRTRQPLLLGVGSALGWELLVGLFFIIGKRSRDRLERRHARRVTNILESLSDGVIVADTTGTIQFANPAAAAMAPRRRPNVPPSAWSQEYGFLVPGTELPFPPEDLPLARAIRGETTNSVEVQVRNQRVPNGVRVSVSGAPMLDSKGRVRGGVVVLRDITEHKEAEDRLRRLSNALEQTADTVVITDRHGTIEYVNPAFEATTGYSKEEAIGENPKILKSGQQSPEFYRNLWETILRGETFRGTTVNRKKDGSFFYAEQTITPMRDHGNGITHFVSVLKDMTERRKIQEQEIELEVAAMVQRRLFPSEPPQIAGYDLAGAVFSAEATSGDYFDFVPMVGDSLGVVVADVSGHGLGPALVMAETRAYLRSLARGSSDLVTVGGTINHFLVADLDDRFFVTMLMICLEPISGRVTWVNAGHPSGYVIDGAGKIAAELQSTCLPLGLFEERWRCMHHELVIEPGSVLVMVTDGVLESEAPDGTEFGTERLLATIRENLHLTADEIVERTYGAVRDFAQRQVQRDDVTIVICKRHW